MKYQLKLTAHGLIAGDPENIESVPNIEVIKYLARGMLASRNAVTQYWKLDKFTFVNNPKGKYVNIYMVLDDEGEDE